MRLLLYPLLPRLPQCFVESANVELQWFVVGIVDSAVVSHSHNTLRSWNETVTWCSSTTLHSYPLIMLFLSITPIVLHVLVVKVSSDN